MPKSIFVLYLFLFPLFATAQTADFTFKSVNDSFCSPAAIQFTQNCTGNPIGFIWDFGDGTKGYTGDELVTYTRAGSFRVSLIALYSQKTVTVTKTVIINREVITSINSDKNYICNPGRINFTAVSTGNILNYSWDFGDTTGIINTVSKDTTHSYPNFGEYTVTLKAIDTSGCVGVANTTIKVMKPPITGTAIPDRGCIPVNVTFNTDVTVPVNDFVSKYTWDFGDGNPVTSTPTKSTTHQYLATGYYYPKLSIITNDGCSNTFDFPDVGYGIPPVNHIAYPKKDVACGSETMEFVSKADSATRYDWTFGDGTRLSVQQDTLVRHKYNTLGIKKVTATPYFIGCPGVQINFNIEVVGVIARFTYANTCIDRKTYSFNSSSLGKVSSYEWDFGDSSAKQFTRRVVHTYPDTGQFIASLTVYDSITGCSDVYRQTIYTAKPVLMNPDSSICKNTDTRFSVLNSYSNNLATYTWNIAGKTVGPSTDAEITVKASKLGNFTNNFVSIKYGSQSCADTIQLDHLILVRGPDLKFSSPTPICLNTTTTLINTSKPFVDGDSIILMYWNYGNPLMNDTIYQPLPFQLPRPGTYRMKLTALDNKGCQDSLIQGIRVDPNPFLQVIPHFDTMCFGVPDTLIAFSDSEVLWSPTDNISCSDCDTVGINPDGSTKYIITAKNTFNCSVQDSAFVHVVPLFTAQAPANPYYICLNDNVQLDVEPKNKVVKWAPATGLSNSTIYSPVAAPVQSTTYVATLTDTTGCFSSSASIDVIVKSLPTVEAGPDKVVPYNSAFTISPAYASNVSSYSWTPSTLLSCNSCAVPSGTAPYSETYSIKVTSDSGCVASDVIRVFVECKESNLLMPKAFTPNYDNLNDTYYPLTRGFKTITKFIIYNRQGQLIFEAKNFPPNSKSFGWNGSFKGEPQPAAAYIYVLEAICDFGERLTKKGSFLLLR